MAWTERYCNPDLTTGSNDGTSEADAWQSLSTAFANAVAGERVNVKRTASRDTINAHVSLTNGPSATAGMYFRGYESTIGDGGIYECAARFTFDEGVICEGFDVEWDGYTSNLVEHLDTAFRCRVKTTNGLGDGMSCYHAIFCHVEAIGSGSLYALESTGGMVIGNRVIARARGISSDSRAGTIVMNNVVIGSGSDAGIYVAAGNSLNPKMVAGNRVYNFARGVEIGGLSDYSDGFENSLGSPVSVSRNVLSNCDIGIRNSDATHTVATLIQNAFYNMTTGQTSGFGEALAAAAETLSADPFVDAVNDDLTLNDTSGGGALLRSLGFAINHPYDWDNMTNVATFEGSGGGGAIVNQGLHAIEAGVTA